jgi:hypothetical protein
VKVHFLILVALAAGVLTGLGCTPKYTAPMQRPPETIAGRNFQTLWDAARTTLKDYRFPLYRQDRRDGVITTRAVASSHGLEQLWRKDAATMFHLQENTFHTVYRAARVRITRVAGTDEFDFSVEVAMARSDVDQQVPTASSELATGLARRGGGRRGGSSTEQLVYHDLLSQSIPPGLNVPGGSRFGAQLVPLGRDQDLEFILAREIRQRAGLAHRALPQEQATPIPTEPAEPVEPVAIPPADGVDQPGPEAIEPATQPVDQPVESNPQPDRLVPLTDLPSSSEPASEPPAAPPASQPAEPAQPERPASQPDPAEVQAELESLLDEPTDAPSTRPADEPIAPPSP